jgi:N-acetylmuramic acid 6-phosphate etherase
VELTPTFAWPQERLRFIIAGESAFTQAPKARKTMSPMRQTSNAARSRLRRGDRGLGQWYDPIYRGGATAGGHSAITIGAIIPALRCSHQRDIPCSSRQAELIAGSTRMKRDRAEGRLNSIDRHHAARPVYRGMMVNMQMTNAKLKRRAEAMVARIASCSEAQAACALGQPRGYQDGRTCGVGLRQRGSRAFSASHQDSVVCSLISLVAEASEVEPWFCSKDGG